MLTASDRISYEARLLDERRRAVRMLQQSASEQVSDETDGDPGDRAALETERHLGQLVSTKESDTVAAIDEALRLIATSPEKYGFCRKCGKPIPRARLDVLPWALDCERHAPRG
jgi:RNA polymerase-binding transcription factor DksA